MPLEPYDWNVIIAGWWNRAILTPRGIATRLFGLQADAPIELEVPIDALGPYRTTHGGLTVMAMTNHLLIQPRESRYEGLARAMQVGRTAVEALPETPLLAVGINVRYRTSDPGDRLREAVSHAWDADLSDEGFQIGKRGFHRSIIWNDGVINLTLTETDGAIQVEFNIEKSSQSRQDHVQWLGTDIQRIEAVVRQVLTRTIHLPEEDIPNG